MSKITQEILAKYQITDEDTAIFLRNFDENIPGKVLEVGAHDEPVANILSECGYQVIGVDLREYNPNQDLPTQEVKPPCNYTYVRADFCDLPKEFLLTHWETFDIAISLSAIEHFGLGTYGEGRPHAYYDVLALRTIWQLLKTGGVCYLTVPFGGWHLDVVPHWRVYDRSSVAMRLVQDFSVIGYAPFVVGDCELDGKPLKIGDPISWEQANRFSGNPPHISILLKLQKDSKSKRLSPDGR